MFQFYSDIFMMISQHFRNIYNQYWAHLWPKPPPSHPPNPPVVQKRNPPPLINSTIWGVWITWHRPRVNVWCGSIYLFFCFFSSSEAWGWVPPSFDVHPVKLIEMPELKARREWGDSLLSPFPFYVFLIINHSRAHGPRGYGQLRHVNESYASRVVWASVLD